MTPFEQEVAEALAVAMGCRDMADAKRTYPDEGRVVWDDAVGLAPHVAAAIEAALPERNQLNAPFRLRHSTAALDALRGASR